MILKQNFIESRQKPFPTSSMPSSVQSFVHRAASSIGVDHSSIALPLLVSLAGAIGNTKRIELKRGYSEPAIIWGLVIARSGGGKSPAIQAATKAMEDVEKNSQLEHSREMDRFREEHPSDSSATPPSPRRFVISNPTTQAVMPLLAANPRGLLLIRQELGAWLGSFNQFSRGGGDEQTWLEFWDGRFASDDRKTGDSRTTFVPRANVSIIGGIQPGIMSKAFPRDRISSGMLPRFLLTRPELTAKLWSDEELPPSEFAPIGFIVRQLASARIDADAEPEAVKVSPGALECYRDFYNRNATEALELPESMSAPFSKLRAYAARLALVLHETEQAATNEWQPEGSDVSADTMERAIDLTDWFAHEARRVYGQLEGDDCVPAGVDDAISLIERRGGEISPREFHRARRRDFKSADAAEMFLSGLTKEGFGTWRTKSPGSGPAVRVFELAPELRSQPEGVSERQVDLGDEGDL